MTANRTRGGVACLGTALILAGCSGNAAVPDAAPSPNRASTAAGSASSPTAAGSASSPTAAERTPTKTQVPVPSGVVGNGCEDYVLTVPTGPGALDGMGRDPVAVALGNSTLLTTFAGALKGNLNPEVNLFDAVNTGQFTVFAPTDDAFGKVSPETIETFKGDPKLLTDVLNYHIVPGQIVPDDIAGEHKTVQGQSLTVTGSGDSLRVNNAGVVCGGIRTANATVYLIDGVLSPPAAPPPTPTTSATETTETTATPTP